MSASLRLLLTWIILFPLHCLPKTPGSAQELSLERIWEIGSIEGPDETIWQRISDAGILGGRVYVADIELSEVRAFSLQGEYLGLVGGPGQGPLEFARPLSMQVVHDTLRIYDKGLQRWVILDEAGNHVRTERPDVPPRSNFLKRIWRAKHDWWVGETSLIGRRLPSDCDTTHLTITWRSFDQTDTLSSISGNPLWLRVERSGALVMHTVDNIGPSGGTWVLGDSLLVLVDGALSTAEIWAADPDGWRLVLERSLNGERSQVTDVDKGLIEADYYRRHGLVPEETTIQGFRVPEQWAAWTRVRGDGQGSVWIRRGGGELFDPGRGERWVRWTLEDNGFSEIEAPPGVEILQFGEGHAVGLRRDDLGVEYLLLFRIAT